MGHHCKWLITISKVIEIQIASEIQTYGTHLDEVKVLPPHNSHDSYKIIAGITLLTLPFIFIYKSYILLLAHLYSIHVKLTQNKPPKLKLNPVGSSILWLCRRKEFNNKRKIVRFKLCKRFQIERSNIR